MRQTIKTEQTFYVSKDLTIHSGWSLHRAIDGVVIFTEQSAINQIEVRYHNKSYFECLRYVMSEINKKIQELEAQRDEMRSEMEIAKELISEWNG